MLFSESPIHDPNYRRRAILTPLAIVIGLIAVSIAVICVYLLVRRYLLQQQGLGLTGLPLVEAPPTPVYELDNLRLNTVINSGRYGEVWKGTLNDISVSTNPSPVQLSVIQTQVQYSSVYPKP